MTKICRFEIARNDNFDLGIKANDQKRMAVSGAHTLRHVVWSQVAQTLV